MSDYTVRVMAQFRQDSDSLVLVGQRWRHKERGTVYEIIAVASGQGGDIEGRDVVVYVDAPESRSHACSVWAREKKEFLDGRFELEDRGPLG